MPATVRFALLATAASFALAACKKDADLAPPEQVVPLRVGHTWEYTRYQYNADGRITDSTTVVRSVRRDTALAGSTWYILSDGSIVQNGPQGYLRYNPGSLGHVIVYPNATYGGSPGYNYVYPTHTLWVLTSRAAAPAPVPASRQRHTATRYHIELQYLYPAQSTPLIQLADDYISPTHGLVRADLYSRSTGLLQQRLELQRFTPQP
ncbi:hypothetical protein [Hymenobacter sp. B81]|uniref:hypothetical protein n=1 Tax=Hymenobacter sp. B81 TaxID=3344878 RepID=UPI0037DD381F